MPTLTWLNKDQAVTAAKRSAYRLLEEEPDLSYGDANNENLLIQGDNLEALKALIPFYAGKVKCIFIDPPYNTESAFEHYDDNLEHSKWLSLIYPRLELLRELLHETGTFWVTIGDDQHHYLKIMLDEVFGRNNFINQVSAKMKQASGASGGGEDKKLKKNVEYVLVYAKNLKSFRRFRTFYEHRDLFDYIDEMKAQGKSWKYTRAVTDFGNADYLKTIGLFPVLCGLTGSDRLPAGPDSSPVSCTTASFTARFSAFRRPGRCPRWTSTCPAPA